MGSLRTKAGNPALFIDVVEQCYRAEPRPERRELASVIDEYPLCKRLMEAYRRVYHMPNKTPLSILFEYASRLNLQVCPTLMIRQMCSGSLNRSHSCDAFTGLHAVSVWRATPRRPSAEVVKHWWCVCSSRLRRDRHRKVTSP